jgi:hypothetical protein
MEYKVVSSSSPEGLTIAVNNAINDGWEPTGSHQVVMHHSQNRYSGSQHMDTRHQADYSQTMIKKGENKLKLAIEVLETLYVDAEMAIDGRWDRTNDGFYDQMTLIDNTLSKIK